MKNLLSPDLLLDLLRQTFGARVELIDSTIGNEQPDYLVLLARLRHPSITIVVKLAGPAAPLACTFERTAWLHQIVAARTSIPMPEVVAVDTTYQAWPWRYLIKTHIPGHEWAAVQPVMDPAELADAYRQIGDAVAQLHSIHFPAFGELAADGSLPDEPPYLAALSDHARLVIKNPHLCDLFLSALEARRHVFVDVQQASLCHEDLHKHNILFEQRQGRWRLATILDFEKSWAGYAETDLARLELWDGMTGQAFWAAYKALCPVDPLYMQRRPLYQLLWCFEVAWPGEAHLADTRRLFGELGLGQFEGFG